MTIIAAGLGAVVGAEQGGLTSRDAAARLTEHGPNALPAQRGKSLWQRLASQFRDPLVLVLLAAAALTLVTGDHADTAIIALVIIANTTVGVVQEIKADGAIAALRALTAVEARVVRDGVSISVDAKAVVPDDLILIGEGDIVCADADVLDAAALLVDESALTGESTPVAKDAGDDLAAGTVVVHGRGSGLVRRTGVDSAMGRIASTLSTGPSLTPLQHRLADLGRVLAGIAAFLGLVVMAIGLIRGQAAELMVITAVSLVVAAVPESLPAVVTLSLALGARRMAARHALVRRLPAVETLGSVTVLATDKTGTLTAASMVAEAIWTPDQEVRLTGTGFDPVGDVMGNDGRMDASHAQSVADLLIAAVLCNDASLRPPVAADAPWQAIGDPTEAALLAAAPKLPVDTGRALEDWPRVAELPFDSVRKRMVTAHRRQDGKILVVCKGAPESVLTSTVLREAPSLLDVARARADAYAEAGYRVLAVATAERDELPDDLTTVESHLDLKGLVALADPPRANAAATISACRSAGITPVLITGDHLATARNIADRVGISTRDNDVALGADLGDASPSARDLSVVARADPAHKLHLITQWQNQGEVVAMTGDGVNDAPALRRADIGVAMGKRGTDIARQAADMVLADDDLETIVAAVEEGRRVYANVRRFLLYALAGGVAEIIVMLTGPAIGLALPLLPAQILWVNLLTHGLPGVAMGAEPATPNLMRRPPRPADQSVLGDGLWRHVLIIGAVVAAASLGAGAWARSSGVPPQTAVFLVLGMSQLGVALAVRARHGTRENPFLPLAISTSLLLLLAGVYLAPLRDVLGTQSMAAAHTVGLCTAMAVGYVVTRAVRRFHQSEV